MFEKSIRKHFVLNAKTTARELAGSFGVTTDFEAGWPVIDSDLSGRYSRCGALQRESQKVSKIKRNDGEVWRKPFRSFLKYYTRVQEIHQPHRRKQFS